MALDFNKIEEPDDSVFPVKLEDDSNLDMYGVWVKKSPERKDDQESDILPIENDTAENPLDDDILSFDDHDIIDLDASDDSLEFEELTASDDFDKIDDNIFENTDTPTESEFFNDEFDIFDEPDAVLIDEGEVKNENYEFEDKSSLEEPIFDDIKETEKDGVSENEVSKNADINEFENLDVDEFLSDEEFGASSETDEKENSITQEGTGSENNIKLDLSFDEDYLENKESDAIDFEGDDFEVISDEMDAPEVLSEQEIFHSGMENLPERKIDDIADLDQIIDELDSNDQKNEDITKTDTRNEIPLNIAIDEDSDISSLAGKNMGSDDELEDVAIFTDITNFEDVNEDNKKQDEDKGLIIESTIIEAGNIEEIREENRKIMDSSSSANINQEKEIKEEPIDDFDSMLDNVMGTTESIDESKSAKQNDDIFFDDIQALENDLLDSDNTQNIEDEDTGKAEKNTEVHQSTALANDRATEILIQIAGELSSIKNELATLKSEMAQAKQKAEEPKDFTPEQTSVTENILNEVTTEKDESGFFNDDDGDETIALTGDELNNILITADFTEENAEKDYEIPETLDDINDAFLTDDKVSDNTETYTDKDLLNSVEPEHINDINEDLSYLDESEEPNVSIDTDDGLDEQNVKTDDFDDFDLKITELELPDGQSIPLGDEYIDINTITENVEEGHDEASDIADLSFTEDKTQIDEDNTGLDIADEIKPAEVQEDYIEEADNLDVDDGVGFKDIPEAHVENHDDTVFSAEELDQASKEIPRLDLEETAAEQQKIKTETLPIHLKDEIKSVLTYMDQLLESLPEEKIEEFAKSEYFDTYKRLFDELGIS